MLKMLFDLKNKLLYKALFILVLLFMTIPYFQGLLSPYVKIFLVWGGIYIVYDIAKGYRFWKDKSLLILLGFCAAYGVSILVNASNGALVPNVKALAYMVLIFMTFYGQDGRRDKEEVLQEMKLLSGIIVGVTFVLAVICFLTYVFWVQYVYVVGDTVAYIGMRGKRLWGLYNANTGGALYVTSILLSVWLISVKKKKNPALSCFCIVNIIVQFACLFASESRTSLYSLLLGGAAGVFLWMWQKKKNIIICLLSAIILLGAGYAGNKFLPDMIYSIPVKVEKWQEQKKKEEAKRIEAEASLEGAAAETNEDTITKDKNTASKKKSSETNVVETSESETSYAQRLAEEQRLREQKRGTGGLLSGRLLLWEAGIKAWLKQPVFGVTREGLYDAAVGYIEESAWHPDLKVGGIHNGYLTILVSSGIVGMAVIILFFGYTLKKLIPLLWKRKCDAGLVIGITFLIMYAVMETMEARSMYQMNIFFVMLWMYYGYVMYLAKAPDAGKDVV